MAWKLHEEWGIRYTTVAEPTMAGGPDTEQVVLTANNEEHARLVVERRLPLSGWDHEAVRRFVTEWEAA